jgi:hypothetical protein
MALINNTAVNTTIGQNLSGTYATIDYNTDNLVSGSGTVYATIKWYKSKSDYDSAPNKNLAIIYPLDNGVIVNTVNFEMSVTDVIKASGESTFQDVYIYFNTRVMNSIIANYGWDVVLG